MSRRTAAQLIMATVGFTMLVSCGSSESGNGGSGSSDPLSSSSSSAGTQATVPATAGSTDTTVPTSECQYEDIVPVPPPADLDIREGDCGPGVHQVQQLLSYLGYEIELDGGYGSATAAVVSQYQTSVGLAPTGVIDATTFGQLDYDATP